MATRMELGSFPANQYDLGKEYGRAGFDVRQRAFIGGSIAAPYGISLSPFIVASSGGPFNITLGRDLNGDSLFTDRPAWATALDLPSVVRTSYGVFDSNPTPGQTVIPRNLGTGPGRFMVNLRLSKSFGFGERTSPAGAGRPPSLTRAADGGCARRSWRPRLTWRARHWKPLLPHIFHIGPQPAQHSEFGPTRGKPEFAAVWRVCGARGIRPPR